MNIKASMATHSPTRRLMSPQKSAGKQLGPILMTTEIPRNESRTVRREFRTAAFAQSYAQLIVQARSIGRSPEDLAKLRCAYELAEEIADGMYRANGAPFLNHLVRTASILLAVGEPLEVVIAAMLHGIYLLDRHEGSRRRKANAAQRRYVASAIGVEAEELVWSYTLCGFLSRDYLEKSFTKAAAAALSGQEKRVLTIQMANELEDHLDLAVLFAGKRPNHQRISEHGGFCVSIASRLGLEEIADGLRHVYAETLAATIEPFLQLPHRGTYERSCRHFGEKSIALRVAAPFTRLIQSIRKRASSISRKSLDSRPSRQDEQPRKAA